MISLSNGAPYYGIEPVFVGSAANDGTGNNLRNAFITTNNNLISVADFLFTDPTLPKLTILGNLIVFGSTTQTVINVVSNLVVVSNTLASNVVTTVSSLTTSNISQVAIASISSSTYRSAEFKIQSVDAVTPRYHTSIIRAIHDGLGNVNSVEYGSIDIGGLAATFTANISSGNLRILATPTSSNLTTFTTTITATTN